MTHDIHNHQGHGIIRNKHSLWPVLCAEQHLGCFAKPVRARIAHRPKAQIKSVFQTGADPASLSRWFDAFPSSNITKTVITLFDQMTGNLCPPLWLSVVTEESGTVPELC